MEGREGGREGRKEGGWPGARGRKGKRAMRYKWPGEELEGRT